MKTTIGLIAPNKVTRDNAFRVLKDEILNGRLIIELLTDKEIVKQAEALIAKGANAIIARGGTYEDLIRANLSVPIILLSYYTEDILQSISKAREIGSKVMLIMTSKMVFEIEDWKDMINVDLEIIKFSDVEEIDDIINDVFESYDFPVVVGGALTCAKAKIMGLSTVEVHNSDASILTVYNQTLQTMNLVAKSSQQLGLLSTVLDNVNDGIIVIDHEGYIEHINNNLYKYFPSVTKQFSHKKIEELIPELGFLLEAIEGKEIKNRILKIDKFILNINAVRVKSDKDSSEVVCTVQDLTEIQKLEENLRHKLNPKGLSSKYTFEDIYTKNKAMKTVIENAREFATTDSTVLIYGESGTGKEMVAQSIHNYSNRKNAPFVAVNCGALSESLLESELFGYVEGAFTGASKGGKAGLFELAHKGTIFLDEINSLPLEIQSRFLRVIEEKEVMRLGSDYVIPLDIRIIIASNENLIMMVENGEFRSDLFYRLNVLEVRIPPIRERKDDIIPLFKMFLKELGVESLPLTKGLEDKLREYRWRGNIREIKNIAERYALLKERMNFDFLNESDTKINITTDDLKIDLKELNKTVEGLVINSLVEKGISKNEISDILGISRTTLWKKINEN